MINLVVQHPILFALYLGGFMFAAFAGSKLCIHHPQHVSGMHLLLLYSVIVITFGCFIRFISFERRP
jgi:hypothetical protein